MTKDSPSADDATGQPAPLSRSAETLGSFLKRHRQSQGKDLDEVAKETRIHASSLRAIEEDNPKALPAEVFTRGFVKNYAQYLGLDPNEALAWYIEQNDGEARPTEKINVQEVLAGEELAEVRNFPAGRLIAFLVVVAVFILAGYLVLDFLNSSAPPADIPVKEAMPQAQIEPPPPVAAPLTSEPGLEPGAAAGDAGAAPASTETQGAVQEQAPSLPVASPEKAAEQAVAPQKGAGEQGQEVKKKQMTASP